MRLLFLALVVATAEGSGVLNESFKKALRGMNRQGESRNSQEQERYLQVLSEDPYMCDYLNDGCAFAFDGLCDADGVNCDLGSDCFDCDPCRAYDLDGCTACTENGVGCSWCPGDARCMSEAGVNAFTSGVAYDADKISSCSLESDWVSPGTCSALDESSTNVFTDPLYDGQAWAYKLLNVEAVWERNITGEGVMVRVNDDGIDPNHPEFSSKFSPEASCDKYLSLDYDTDVHGTFVASIAVGSADNGECATGIAPGASLSACRTLGTDPTNTTEAVKSGIGKVDIDVNSWGRDPCTFFNNRRLQQGGCPFELNVTSNPCQDLSCADGDWKREECQRTIFYYCNTNIEDDPGCADYVSYYDCDYTKGRLLLDEQVALKQGIEEGRMGKGIIYVFAAGNEFHTGEDVNMEAWLNSRYTITVGAVGKNGDHARYSTGGAALFVSGPGGDSEFATNHITATPGGGCTDATVGTSFACPAVAGAIALILQAAPNLGWRDVQDILAKTSHMTDPEHASWQTNAAGRHHSDLYGFGVVDALAAVEEATSSQREENLGPERNISAVFPTEKLIVDDPSSPTFASVTIEESVGSGFVVESVVVRLLLDHVSRGDLKILLVSPEGTESVLHPGSRPENTLLFTDPWELMTVKNWGESPIGDWNIFLVDERLGVLEGCVDNPVEFLDVETGEELGFGCELLSDEVCANRTVVSEELVNSVTTEEAGVGAASACCKCGGGIEAAMYENGLFQATLNVYGRYVMEVFESDTDDDTGEGSDPLCGDTPSGWADDAGDGCVWYEDDDNCEVYGNILPSATEDGRTANEACCICGGGSTASVATSKAKASIGIFD